MSPPAPGRTLVDARSPDRAGPSVPAGIPAPPPFPGARQLPARFAGPFAREFVRSKEEHR